MITTVVQTSSLAADGVQLQSIKGDEHADALITDLNVGKERSTTESS